MTLNFPEPVSTQHFFSMEALLSGTKFIAAVLILFNEHNTVALVILNIRMSDIREQER